jgi:hypothetical protein
VRAPRRSPRAWSYFLIIIARSLARVYRLNIAPAIARAASKAAEFAQPRYLPSGIYPCGTVKRDEQELFVSVDLAVREGRKHCIGPHDRRNGQEFWMSRAFTSRWLRVALIGVDLKKCDAISSSGNVATRSLTRASAREIRRVVSFGTNRVYELTFNGPSALILACALSLPPPLCILPRRCATRGGGGGGGGGGGYIVRM